MSFHSLFLFFLEFRIRQFCTIVSFDHRDFDGSINKKPFIQLLEFSLFNTL